MDQRVLLKKADFTLKDQSVKQFNFSIWAETERVVANIKVIVTVPSSFRARSETQQCNAIGLQGTYASVERQISYLYQGEPGRKQSIKVFTKSWLKVLVYFRNETK
jgi:hypothetical protein